MSTDSLKTLCVDFEYLEKQALKKMVRKEQRNRRVANLPKINPRKLEKTSSGQRSLDPWGNLRKNIFNLIQ